MERQINLSAYKNFEARLENITSTESEARADAVRSILLKDNDELKDLIARKEVSLDRLRVLIKDKPQQRMYMWLMKKSKEEGTDPNQTAKDEELSKDVYAGFLVFKRRYYEGELGRYLFSEWED